MAEIKFTTERMKEVYDRLDDMKLQLKNSTDDVNGKLNSISLNITGDNLGKIVSEYIRSVEACVEDTKKKLFDLESYLQTKIINYSTVNQNSTENLSEVDKYLSMLEG